MGRPPRINREQILESARSHFGDVGFDSATLGDIAASLGVTPAAILRHFDSKQALFVAAMTPSIVEPPACVFRLAAHDGRGDPRVILRSFAEEFIPFVRAVLGASLAVNMHARSRRTSLVLPFDTSDLNSPPRRGLQIVTDYFKRAKKAGTIDVDDPRAAALLFVGNLQSYVLIHEVLGIGPAYPVDKYIDALLSLWTKGAIRTSAPSSVSTSPRTKSTKRVKR